MTTLTADQKTYLAETVKRVIAPMDVSCEVNIQEGVVGEKNVVTVAISAPEDARFLIGKNGQNLQALEHVVRAVFAKESQDQTTTLFVDVNDYKKSRALQVATLARETAIRVRDTQRAEALAPMSPYERRVVHLELAAVSDVVTESIGQEPQRRIVIKPHKN